MRKLPHIFLASIALTLSVGCSSPGQTQLEEESENPVGSSMDAADGGSGGADHDANIPGPSAQPKSVQIVAQLDPGFIKVSKELKEAVGSIGQAPAQIF